MSKLNDYFKWKVNATILIKYTHFHASIFAYLQLIIILITPYLQLIIILT